METGIVRYMEADEYHEVPAASASNLKLLLNGSAYNAKVAMETRKDTPAMLLGRLVDMALLEPDLLCRVKQLPKDMNRTRKADKELYNELCVEYGAENLIDFETYERAISIKKAIEEHPAARALLDQRTDTQISLFWKDPVFEIPCKGRPDFLCEGIETVVDVKTTIDASPGGYSKSLWDYGAHIQAAHYRAGLAQLGRRFSRSVLIVAETTGVPSPEKVAVYEIGAKSLLVAGFQLARAKKMWKEYTESGIWPGYSTGIETLELPGWAIAKEMPSDAPKEDIWA